MVETRQMPSLGSPSRHPSRRLAMVWREKDSGLQEFSSREQNLDSIEKKPWRHFLTLSHLRGHDSVHQGAVSASAIWPEFAKVTRWFRRHHALRDRKSV